MVRVSKLLIRVVSDSTFWRYSLVVVTHITCIFHLDNSGTNISDSPIDPSALPAHTIL